MRTEADTGACVGSSQCVLTEPAVCDQDDGIVATLMTEAHRRHETEPSGTSAS